MPEPRAAGLVRDKRVDVFDTSVSMMPNAGNKRGLGHRSCRRETVSQRALRHTWTTSQIQHVRSRAAAAALAWALLISSHQRPATAFETKEAS